MSISVLRHLSREADSGQGSAVPFEEAVGRVRRALVPAVQLVDAGRAGQPVERFLSVLEESHCRLAAYYREHVAAPADGAPTLDLKAEGMVLEALASVAGAWAICKQAEQAPETWELGDRPDDVPNLGNALSHVIEKAWINFRKEAGGLADLED